MRSGSPPSRVRRWRCRPTPLPRVPFSWITADEAYGQVKYLRVCRSNIGLCGLTYGYAAWWYSLITPATTGLRRMIRGSVRSAAFPVGSV